ncbi:MAG: DUF5337 family protein [Pseudomonadota bacterium]
MMKPNDPEDLARVMQARTAAIVVAATMVLWIGANFAGRELGLPVRYVFLFDFAALAAFFWALVVGVKLWRARQTKE